MATAERAADALAAGALGDDAGLGDAFPRLAAVVARLRRDCPWDAEQTHASLAKHLVEETAEALDAIEAGTPEDLREELGDLLIQVCFHAELARQDGWFDLDDVIAGVVDKLIGRHPWVFGDAAAPTDMMASWESAKRAEKARASCLEGIPDALNTLARAAKVVTRVRDVHRDGALGDLPAASGGTGIGEAPADAANRGGAPDVGPALLGLVARAQDLGIDPDQALRAATRELEARVRKHEAQDKTA